MINVQSYVMGKWLEPAADAAPIKDASTGEAIALIGHNGLPFKEMLAYARTTGGNALRQSGFHDRAKMIKALALHLLEHKKQLYDLSACTGATATDSKIDIDGGIQTMLVFASKGRREMPDSQVFVDGNIEELSRDGSFKGVHIATPLLGTAIHINAFNFPVWGMLEKLAPTWLAGVPAIVKPASQTAYLTAATVRFIVDSGLIPEGALQLIAGAADGLLDCVDSQDVISFTGSAATAIKLRSHPNVLNNCVRFIAEQDSLNATILGRDITADSADFALFIKEIVNEMTVKAGQKCTAIRRILVPMEQVQEVSNAISSRLATIKPGDPRDKATRMGPLVSIGQHQDVLEKAQKIATECDLVYGKMPENSNAQTAFCEPMLFYCAEPDEATTVHELEAFGPVATIMGYTSESHAAQLVNKGKGSLVASIFTQSTEVAKACAYAVAPWHGRLYFNNSAAAKSSTGHGSPLPHLIHGGPGRAGGGEEMGGIRGVLHYMQRTAIQGHPDLLSAITSTYVPQARQHSASSHQFTRCFGELQIGESITSAKRTITLEDIEHFAAFTGDNFYAHMDQQAAQANPFFPGRVAHGYLLLSFAAGLFVKPEAGPVLANTGLNNLKFIQPVVPGDAIYVRLTVKRKTRRTAEYGEVRWHVEINNQSDEAVAEYELLTMNAYTDPYAS